MTWICHLQNCGLAPADVPVHVGNLFFPTPQGHTPAVDRVYRSMPAPLSRGGVALVLGRECSGVYADMPRLYATEAEAWAAGRAAGNWEQYQLARAADRDRGVSGRLSSWADNSPFGIRPVREI